MNYYYKVRLRNGKETSLQAIEPFGARPQSITLDNEQQGSMIGNDMRSSFPFQPGNNYMGEGSGTYYKS